MNFQSTLCSVRVPTLVAVDGLEPPAPSQETSCLIYPRCTLLGSATSQGGGTFNKTARRHQRFIWFVSRPKALMSRASLGDASVILVGLTPVTTHQLVNHAVFEPSHSHHGDLPASVGQPVPKPPAFHTGVLSGGDAPTGLAISSNRVPVTGLHRMDPMPGVEPGWPSPGRHEPSRLSSPCYQHVIHRAGQRRQHSGRLG